jgi:membrane dipeptidase
MNNNAQSIPIFDGHNDLLMRLYKNGDADGGSFFIRSNDGDIDLPRAREGSFAGGFFAVFVPADPSIPRADEPERSETDSGYRVPLPPPLDIAYAQRTVFAMTATLFRIEARSSGEFRVVLDMNDLEECLRRGTIAAILPFEGAEAIDPELNALEVFYRAGLRSLGIVWSRPNAFGHGVPFAFPHSPDTGPGLTDAGRELVRACNRLGIMIDLSHINERGFRDVAQLSTAPLVATHSNVHPLCRSTRNLTDSQLDAIRESGGVVGLNFANCFLRDDGGDDTDTPLETMVRHVDYMCERMGPDHVCFGSDFDGAAIPAAIGDVAGLPNLVEALRGRGYDDPTLRKLGYENWLRVLKNTWKSQ